MPNSSVSAGSSHPSNNISDLVRRTRQGDAAATDRLFALYRPYLRVICTLQLPRLYQRREDGSDIVQQTLVDALRGLADFRGQSTAEFGGWMARLLERNILQTVRRHTAEKRDVRRETIDWNPTESAQLVWHSLAADKSSPEKSFFRGEAALELAQALEKLPEDQRLAVELRYLGQQSLASIAESMDKSTGSVAGLIRRGVESLRDLLPDRFAEQSFE